MAMGLGTLLHQYILKLTQAHSAPAGRQPDTSCRGVHSVGTITCTFAEISAFQGSASAFASTMTTLCATATQQFNTRCRSWRQCRPQWCPCGTCARLLLVPSL